MKYKVGQKLKYIGKVLKGNEDCYTTGKIYIISGFSDNYHSFRGVEYYMIRDDSLTGLWWEEELDKKFIDLKEERKQKIEKLNEFEKFEILG
jgi:hypothetical protein